MGYSGILSSESAGASRIIRDITELQDLVAAVRRLGQRIVLTSGSWDLLHTGHAEYLRAAKGHGDFLVVGVDSDEKIKRRKGPHRPIVAEDERAVMLSHLRYVDLVFIKRDGEVQWSLIRAVAPDVLVVSETSDHSAENLSGMRKLCGELVILEAKSQRGTTARLREMLLGGMSDFAQALSAALPKILEESLERVGQKKGASDGS